MKKLTFSKKQLLIRCIELLFILIWVFPLLWMVITSLKLEEEVITRTFSFWPANPTLATTSRLSLQPISSTGWATPSSSL